MWWEKAQDRAGWSDAGDVQQRGRAEWRAEKMLNKKSRPRKRVVQGGVWVQLLLALSLAL